MTGPSLLRAFPGLVGALAALVFLIAPGPARAGIAVQVVRLAGPSGQAIDAAVWTPDPAVNGPRPLIVISHGSIGTMSGHRDTAEALAEAGFVVAALTHPGDNPQDMSRTWCLTDRAPQVSALIDYLTADWPQAAMIDGSRIGAFGFSAGGFTVASLIGARSDPQTIIDHCADHPDFLLCTLMGPDGIDPDSWQAGGYDARVRAGVIAAPGFGFSFSDESLEGITAPVQLWQAGADQILNAPWHVEPIRDRLPGVEFHRVDGALHHDFMAPCGPELRAAVPELCRSNPGFERAAFKADFNRQVVTFFRTALGG